MINKKTYIKILVAIGLGTVLLCILFYVFHNTTVIFKLENFSFWSSVVISALSILVAILLTFNFSSTTKLMDISKELERKLEKLENLEHKVYMLEELLLEVNRKMQPSLVREMISMNDQIMSYLSGLKSDNISHRMQSVLFFKNYGDKTYLHAIKSALSSETEDDIKALLNQTIGKLENT